MNVGTLLHSGRPSPPLISKDEWKDVRIDKGLQNVSWLRKFADPSLQEIPLG
jgi:hypothetical protein